ncbi:MAG: RAD55 family ATPase [Thermoplasmata archaeon]
MEAGPFMPDEEREGSLLREIRDIRVQLDQLEAQLEEAARQEPRPSPGQVPTFVEGFDAALGGGIPEGHVVLLHGPTGTMKTSLALYILAKNQARGMRCLHLTLEEDRGSLRRTLAGLGLDPEDYIVDIATLRAEHGLAEEAGDWLDILLAYLERKAQDGLDLLALDPLDALFDMAQIRAPRQALFRFFRFLRGAGITALLLVEGDDFLYGEERVADGVLQVTQRELEGGLVSLWMRCVKMRHAAHSRDFHRLEFRDGAFRARPLLSL